jgi:separase
MAPIKAIAESICASVGSDCTATTVTTLSDYLLPKPKSENTRPPTTNSKRTVASSKPPGKAALATNAKLKNKRTVSVKEDTADHCAEAGLSPKERSILATEVINATLKVLNDAIKAPLQAAVRRQPCSKEGTQRKTLRRSISMPQSPLQPRSLNRVASSPGLSNRSSRSSSTASIKIASHRSTAECARVAFACLRSLQAAGIPGVDFPNLQLENGTSALIGKLIALGLDDLALKEVRILKRRMVLGDVSKKSGPKTNGAPIQELAELLNFGNIVSVDIQTWNLVISTQLHIVRLLASTRKQNIRDTLEVLNPDHQSSPTRLLLLIAEDPKNKDKAVRQLQALSDTLLSLCPSVASSDDDLALETRISVPPDVAFQLQTIALHNRLQWWKIANHAADYSKDLLQPFHRCLSTFARRSENDALGAARLATECFRSLCQVWSQQTSSEEQTTYSAVFEIHRLLSSLSQEAGDVEEALSWTRKLKEYTGKVTQARKVTIATRVVALALKRSARHSEDEILLGELLDLLNASYTGTSTDIDDLMTEVSAARRSALAVLSRSTPTCRLEDRLGEGMQTMCEALIFLCPRICLRYFGKPITAQSETKETILYEQKRLYIAKSAYHTIDSTLFLAKSLLGGNRLSWDILDSRLQECLSLLDWLDPDNISPKAESVAPHSYYVKISNLYYTHFLNERRKPDGQKEAQQLNILRRSVDCVQGRSPVEKKAALYSTKLERMADIYKTAGKFEELFDVFKRMQDVQMADGVLSKIALAMTTIPVCLAWETDEQTTLLGRTVHTLLRVQLKYLRQTTHEVKLDESLSTEEQGALLEHQLVYLRTQTKDLSVVSRFQSMIFESLLALYEIEQFPIRRLRVLIELLSLDIELQENISKKITEELQAATAEIVRVEKSKDQGLHPYCKHLQTLALSVLELQQDQPKIPLLKRCVATWSSIQKECQSAEALRQRIDDVPGLLDQLQNISIYCQVRGHDEFRVSVLSLIADLHSQIETTSSSADDAVSNLVDLGAQWLLLGYSGKAGFALDRAHRKCDQSGISTKIMLKLHVNYSDYLQTIGNFDKRLVYSKVVMFITN